MSGQRSRMPHPDVLRALAADKLSRREIAELFGVATRTAERWMDRLGIPSQWEPAKLGHGTVANYQRACRCDACRAANTEYCRRFTGAKPMRRAEHGSIAKYRSGCRCDDCRSANNAARRTYYAAKKARQAGAEQ